MSRRPSVGVILVGDELLSGAVADTNGPYLIQRLRALGARLRRVVTVGDDLEDIAEAVATTAAACDHVCTTGGIGPTHDDVTLEAVGRAFGLAVEEDPWILDWMRRRLGRPPDEGHRRMARVPLGTEVLVPPEGPTRGAPPTLVVRNVVVLPGVPSLMRACFALAEARFRGPARWRQALEVRADETVLATPLRAIAAAHPAVTVGSYPRLASQPGGDTGGGPRGAWIVRLCVEGDARDEVEDATRALSDAFRGWAPSVEAPRRVGPPPERSTEPAARDVDRP